MIITAFNPDTVNIEKSYLTNSYSSGVTSIVIKDNDRFSTNDRMLIGEIGDERSEVVTVTSVNSNKVTIGIGATKFAHSVDDPVYVLRYDKVRIYRSITTIDGTYSLLATVDLDVDNAEKTTRYDDTTGISSYFYKITFYHSISTLESSFSDGIPATGYSRSQVGWIITDFLTEVGDTEQNYMNVPQALNIMNECSDDLTSQTKRPYRFLKTSQTLTVTANNDRVSLPADLLKLDRVKFNYVYGGTNRSDLINVIDIEEMEYIKYDNTAQTGDELKEIAVDEQNREIILFPTPATTQTNKITIYYWKKFTEFNSFGDSIETPTPRIYKMFLIARFYLMRSLHDSSFMPLSTTYLKDYTSEVIRLQRINRIDNGSPTGYRPDVRTAQGLRR